mmetsp:Transcript_70688/g.218255  ORF Transcript_70688/g.218255 Transcript_70688/m.218255 type:complete len:264 (-) Transcript_70688:204-995(-)
MARPRGPLLLLPRTLPQGRLGRLQRGLRRGERLRQVGGLAQAVPRAGERLEGSGAPGAAAARGLDGPAARRELGATGVGVPTPGRIRRVAGGVRGGHPGGPEQGTAAAGATPVLEPAHPRPRGQQPLVPHDPVGVANHERGGKVPKDAHAAEEAEEGGEADGVPPVRDLHQPPEAGGALGVPQAAEREAHHDERPQPRAACLQVGLPLQGPVVGEAEAEHGEEEDGVHEAVDQERPEEQHGGTQLLLPVREVHHHHVDLEEHE